jgi:hypothetical protein
MKVKYKKLLSFAILLGFLLYILLELFFYKMIFFEGELSSKEFYQSINGSGINFTCNNIRNLEQKDLTIHFKYQYPLVNFSGKLIIIIDNEIVNNEDVSRTIYSNDFKENIIIKNLCSDSQKKETELAFLLITENTTYIFRMHRPYPVSNYSEIEVILSYDGRLGNVAIVKPIK